MQRVDSLSALSMASEDALRTDIITLSRFILQNHRRVEDSQEITILLNAISVGCKYVSTAVRKAGLANLYGMAGEENIQGEQQKKLDVLSNDAFITVLKTSGQCAMLVSEENEDAIHVGAMRSSRGKYCVVFDPLDGSSNIDCGVSIGTIFGIYRVEDADGGSSDSAVLRPGTAMVAAGYCMYGSCTELVFSTGDGVNGFTLDPSVGEFVLTHHNIQMPEKGSIYSINEGNAMHWDEVTTSWINHVKFPKDGGKPMALRYVGSMVSDVHRTLLYGGSFLYPGDKKNPNGKLRILYECFPMAFLIEQAGGKATTGHQRILDIVPTSLHQRSPIFLGSKKDIQALEDMYEQQKAGTLIPYLIPIHLQHLLK